MHWLLKLAFILSGATGLIYEIVWGRMLATSLGSTIVAASIVMGVFMGGLALGARFFGSRADKVSFPLKMYALLEAGIGISALVVSTVLPHLQQWYPALSRISGISENLFLKIAIAAIFLLIPAMLMGGTLPVLTRAVVRQPQKLGTPIGILYGLNTLGAFSGCIFSGFYSIEILGLLETTYMAVAINIGIFFCCFFLLSEKVAITSPAGNMARKKTTDTSSSKHPSHVPPRWFLLAYAVSGATGLAYEVLWIRLLSNTFIGTSYGFAAMLGTCLGGMALGSLLFRKKADTVSHPLLWFGGMQAGLSVWAESMLLPYNAFPALQSAMNRLLGISLGSQLLEMLFFSSILVLVPSILLGAMFPLANRIWGGGRNRVGKNVGTLYTFNTVGCVIGSLAAGLLLLPYLGIQNSLDLLGATNGFLALYAVGVSRLSIPKKRQMLVITTSALALLFFLIPGDLTTRAMAHRLKKPWNLLYYHEGLDNNVMILQSTQNHVRRLMTTFFQYIGDTSPVMKRIQKLQAHLPILLCNSPERILFVGMGTGITPGTATAYPADITCCEISQGVMNASRFFASENRDILHNHHISLIREDGRHYLLEHGQPFDLIVGDLYNAALAGMGNLYSREYYSLCLSRLRANGMMCQWVSMKDLPEKELRGIMATFGNVFPHTSLWCATPDILALIGTREPLKADWGKIQSVMNSGNLRQDLLDTGLDSPFALLSHFLMNRKEWNTFAAGAQVVTDDKPYIEYSIPRSLHYLHYREDMPATLRHVNTGRTFLIPPDKNPHDPFGKELQRATLAETHLFKGYACFLENRLEAARTEYRKALSLNPRDVDAKLFQLFLGTAKPPHKKKTPEKSESVLKKRGT